MSALHRAINVLVEAEDRLAALMREGVEHHRYDDVGTIAEVTQRFSEFIRSLERRDPTPENETASTGPRRTKRKRTTTRRGDASPLPAGQQAAYPKFRRDGDRLVKVGWSRKGRKEYQQRAPIEVALRFSAILRDRDDLDSGFVMADLLPMEDEAGSELPSYQAYLALAWLRATGVASRNGRDGYRADPTQLGEEYLKGLWDDVPELGSGAG